jgi:hypothetical protein
MPRVKLGDRIKASHPAGHHLLGEVLSIRKRSCDNKARYCEVKFDHSHKSEWIAIELLELNQVRSNTVAGDIEERVIELGERLPESLIERDIEPSPLTHVLPPKPGTTIAVSTIFPASTGWVECKTIKGRNYYYLRSGSSPQRYLGSTWVKAIDRLPGFLNIRAGLPF